MEEIKGYLREKFSGVLVGAIVTLCISLMAYMGTGAYNWLVYPIHNIKTDSIQSQEIRRLDREKCDKAKAEKMDSIISYNAIKFKSEAIEYAKKNDADIAQIKEDVSSIKMDLSSISKHIEMISQIQQTMLNSMVGKGDTVPACNITITD